MSFSDEAWSRIGPLYAQILELPFNRELAAGTLARERFIFYMLQDAHYLAGSRGRSRSPRRAPPDAEALIQFAGSARAAVVVERALHEGFFKDFGIRPAEAAATSRHRPARTIPTTSWRRLTTRPTRSAVAALLPCFWIYWGGRQASAPDREARQPVPGLDRYLCRRSLRRRVRKVIADHRPAGRGGHARGAGGDARGVRARLPARMDVLGQRLAARDLAGVAADVPASGIASGVRGLL